MYGSCRAESLGSMRRAGQYERRRERAAALAREQARERRRRWLGRALAAGAALGVVLAVGLMALLAANDAATQQPAVGRAVPNEGKSHVAPGTPTTYRHNPPASGPHYPRPAEYGVYEEPLPAGSWVHNLEHGAIVVLYKCPGGRSSCPERVSQLRTLYEQAPPGKYGRVKMVVTQYPKLKTPFAAVAWDRVLELQSFDQGRLLEFYRAWVDKGPEDAP